MGDKFAALRAALEEAVLGAPGETDRTERRRAMEGEGATPELTAFVQRVQRHAYRITDEEVAALRAAGVSDDRLFELLVGAALGAAEARLAAGLRALEGGAGAAPQGR
jgi:alkylhydroperoxidase family enzyme